MPLASPVLRYRTRSPPIPASPTWRAGTTLAITVAPTWDVSYVLKDATGKSDAVALTLSTATTAGLDFSGKNIDLSGIESVSVSSLGTAVNKVTLVDTSATSLTITGAAGLTATLAGATGLTKVDASASTGAIDVSGVAVSASGATILGSATKASVLKGGAGADTITGGTAADTITSGTGLDVLTGGGGNDTFVLSVATSGNAYATVTDANKSDILTFAAGNGTEVFTTTKIATLGSTAVFQDYLDAATNTDGSTNSTVKWFQFGGDTYVVEDNSAALTFQNGGDSVVKLTGAIDLSTAVWAAAGNTLTLG
jgi:S-layer protein